MLVFVLLSYEWQSNLEKYASFPKDCSQVRKPYWDSRTGVYISFSACKTIGSDNPNDVDLILAFPGTRGTRNWLVNLKTAAAEHDWIDGHVHSGFFDVSKKLRPFFAQAIAEIAADLAQEGKNIKYIFFSGHSMGGGLAYLSGLDLMRQLPRLFPTNRPFVHIVTLGTPPFISREFKISVSKLLEDNEDNINIVNLLQHTDSVAFVGNVRSDTFRKNFGVEYVLAAGERILLPVQMKYDAFHHGAYSYESNFNSWAFGTPATTYDERKDEIFALKQ